MSGESLVEEFEDLFLLLLIGVSTDSAIKCLKITWPRRTAYPRNLVPRVFVPYCACWLDETSDSRKIRSRGGFDWLFENNANDRK